MSSSTVQDETAVGKADLSSDTLDARVYGLVQEAVEKGRFPFTKDACRFYLHKSYYSRERNGLIATDVAIELFLPGLTRPSIIWIWECEKQESLISVTQLESFHSRLQQIGSDRTKGTIISVGAYQRAAVEFAFSNGIGLARLLPDDQVQWV